VRIYFVGAHSTGKTTLARWTARAFQLPLVTEAVRPVLACREVPLPVIRASVSEAEAFQRELIHKQTKAEGNAGNTFVSDRCVLDYLAYTAEHTMILHQFTATLQMQAARLREPDVVVFFLRPQRDLLAEDGARETPVWDAVIRIDAMLKCLFVLHGVDYISIDTPNMAERVRVVRHVIRGLGETVGGPDGGCPSVSGTTLPTL